MMDFGSSGTNNRPQSDLQSVRTAAVRSIVSNLLGLIVPVIILLFWFGGPSTRAWKIGFVWGLFGLAGQPHLNSVAEPVSPVSPFAEVASKPPLKLLGHGCNTEYRYEVCEGEVRNETKETLQDVMAEVRFKDAYGTFIKADSSVIDYQPLMPGQSSPFKIMTTDNPQIRHYTISFRQMFGGELKAAR